MKDMKAKFKVTDTIHYMNDNKPKSAKIGGYTIKVGSTRDGSYNETKLKDDEFEIVYHMTSGFDSVKEADCYKTIKALQDALFTVATV